MKITSINDYKDIHQEKDTVLVLGYFDALHRGHKVLFDKARQIADDKQLEVAVLTFNESPQLTFQRYTDDLLLHITAPKRRCDLFEAYGTDQLYLTDFNSDFARTSSDDFIARYIDRLKAQEVVVGFDYKFGHHRTDVDYLARNFSGTVHVIEEQQSEVAPEQIMEEFRKNYLDKKEPIHFRKCQITDTESSDGEFATLAKVIYTDHGMEKSFEGVGNGPIDAVQRGLEEALGVQIKVLDYNEHALNSGSNAQAASYIHLMDKDSGKVTYGVGVSSNITRSSIRGIFSAVNRLFFS